MLMKDCINFEGCDRHLMCMQSNTLKDHYSFKLGGGGGNFKLSTSNVGSIPEDILPIVGGCAPFTEDGYGVFYCYANSFMPYTVLAYNSSEITDHVKYARAIDQAMYDVLSLIKGRDLSLSYYEMAVQATKTYCTIQ